MKVRDDTPSFSFEDEAPEPTPEVVGTSKGNAEAPALEAESTWEEVPQARFLSWSPGMQAAYCAARDEDAAICGVDGPGMTMFYIQRAEMYRCMAKPS